MSLWTALKNRIRGAADKAEEALANPVEDNKFAIEDSEKMAKEFKQKIASGLASLKQMEGQAKELEEKVKKYGKIAEMAVERGNDEDAEKALEQEAGFKSQLNVLKGQIKGFKTQVSQQRERLQKIENQIAKAKSNFAVQKLAHEGAKARKAFVEATTDFGSDNNPLAALDKLEEQTNKLNAEAEAMEEISGVNEESLEDKYSASAQPAVSDRLAALKAKMGK